MLRVLLDLQVLQSTSRDRRSGTCARDLADALLKRPEVAWHVLFSDAMPDTLLPALRWARERIGSERIHVAHGLAATRGDDPLNAVRSRAAEILYAGFTASLAPDLVHVADPFCGWTDDAVTAAPPSHARTAFATTVLDPSALEDLGRETGSWHRRRLRDLTRSDTLLVTSEDARVAVCTRLGLADTAVLDIGAQDPMRAAPAPSPAVIEALRRRYGIARRLVLHVGPLPGDEGVAGLLSAFAALPAPARDSHQIMLATGIPAGQRAHIIALARSLGLAPDAVLIPECVPAADGADLRALAIATLSSVQAMDRERPALTIDAVAPAATAQHLSRILADPEGQARGAAEQAAWDARAERVCAAFAAAHARRNAGARPDRKPALDLSGLAPGRYRLPLAPYFGAGGITCPVPLCGGNEPSTAPPADGPVLEIDLKAGARARGKPPASTGGDTIVRDGATACAGTEATPLAPPVATLSCDLGDPREPWTLTWHSFPRTRTRAELPATVASPGEALSQVLELHPLAQACGTVARLRRLPERESDPSLAPTTLARAVMENHAPATPRPRLLVDVTELALSDARSGIQRVVRNILGALLAEPDGFEVLAIRRQEATYRFARAFTARFLQTPVHGPDAPVDFRPSDTVLGLDLDTRVPARAFAELQRQHRRGVRFVHVLYDTLPVRRPDWFWEELSTDYIRWLRGLAELSDGIACISRATADELARIFAEQGLPVDRRAAIGAFHLGADLDTPPRVGESDNLLPTVPETSSEGHDPEHSLFPPHVPVFLTVGTLEPRKGHTQFLDAAEILWAQDRPLIVAIVGKRGWLVDALVRRIETHPELGRRLRWFEAIDDSLLQRIYRQATVVLLPSEGEGFGLPLVEAARVGLPILARDLPVFREVGGEHASYFNGSDGPALARAIEDWLDAQAAGLAPGSAGIRPLTWAESARQLLTFLRTVPHQP